MRFRLLLRYHAGTHKGVDQRMVVGAVDNAAARAHIVHAAVADMGDETAVGMECHKRERFSHPLVLRRRYALQFVESEVESLLKVTDSERTRPIPTRKRLPECVADGAACHFSFFISPYAVADHEKRLRVFRRVAVGIARILLVGAPPELRK